MKPIRSICVALGGLLLSSCTVGDSIVRPITDVLISGPEFAEITATTATVLVDTSEDLVCSVVYGPTSSYGFIATDTDMAGGGHRDHHPLLTGLEPDTLYYARFQGNGPDGTLYRSEEYTFRTLPVESADHGDPLETSLVGVSSNYGGGAADGGFGALNALDGDPASEWSSDGDGDEAWIEIQVEGTARITTIGFWTRTMGASAEIHSFEVLADGDQAFGPFELSGAGQLDFFETDFTARSLRFNVLSSSGGNTGAVEIEVYGELLE